jgi:outer membrane receptor for ferric coprogen and ferric-rhodotorulic acid
MEHTFANDWVLKANASRMEQDADNLSLFVRGPVDPATGIIQGTGATGATVIAASRHPTRTTLDVFVNGKFQLFSQQHSFAIGADYSKMNGDGQVDYKFSEYPASARRPVDVFNFNPADFARPTNRLVSFTTPVSNQAQSGVYATLGLQLADPLRLIVGARYSNYEIQSQNYYADAAGVLPDQPSYGANYREHALVPSAALTYEITPNWSAYVSYAQSFNPQANLLTAPLPGTPMSAITGEGYELGVKGTAFDNLNVSLSVYRVLRNGEGISDPAYPYTPGEGGSACCYVAMGDAITRGLDLEFSGTILPGWQLFAGYTYNEREANAASANEFLGTALYFNWTPKHLFKTWTTWNLPGSWSKWTLNAGVQAQTQFSGYGFPTPLPHQAGYAIWNASVQYRVSDSWSVALYAENLFDKTYYEAMSTVRNEGLYGVPRNLILRMQYKFN